MPDPIPEPESPEPEAAPAPAPVAEASPEGLAGTVLAAIEYSPAFRFLIAGALGAAIALATTKVEKGPLDDLMPSGRKALEIKDAVDDLLKNGGGQ